MGELDHLGHLQSLHNEFVMNWPRVLARRPEGMTAKTLGRRVKGGQKNSHRAGGYSLLEIWLPTVDTLRNLFYAPTVDMKITFELLRQDRLGGFRPAYFLEGV